MLKTEVIAHLWKEYQCGNEGIYVQVWQKRPYTAVKVIVRMPGYPMMTEYGFTKVCWPDTWDAERGIELAVRKALTYAAKRIVAKERQDDRQTE